MKLQITILGLTVLLAGTAAAQSTQGSVPHAFSPGTPALASEVNANFGALVDALNAQGARRGRVFEVSTAIELQEALDAIPDQTLDAYLIRLAPGTYALTAPLDIPNSVLIDGQFRAAT